MALSTRKKNIIIADWKTGKFKSFNAIAKQYKIAPKTARNLLSGISHENSQIVDDLEVVKCVENSLKNSLKNPHEINAVENAVKDRMKVDKVSNKLLDKIESLIDGGKAQKVVIESAGEAGSSATTIDYDLQADDFKKLADAIDKSSLTQGINNRHSQSVNIQNNNENNQQNNILKVEWID